MTKDNSLISLKSKRGRVDRRYVPRNRAFKAANIQRASSIEISAPNELAAAKYFAQMNEDKFRYSTRHKKWMYWDGTRWAWDMEGKVMTSAFEAIENIVAFCTKRNDSVWRTFGNKMQNAFQIKAMVELAQSQLPLSVGKLDNKPLLLPFTNGTFDLETGEFRKSDPSDYLTKRLEVKFDPDAACPRFIRFMEEIMDGDEEMIKFLQRAVGYTLTGNTNEQVMFILYGNGQNGKSVFMETIGKLMGDFRGVVAPQTLTKKRYIDNSPSSDLAKLHGIRMAIASESGKGLDLSEVTIKQLTGDEKITGRGLYHDYVDFYPTFKIWLSTNHLPRIHDVDDGIWRRPLVIHFPVTISNEKRVMAPGEELC